MIVLDCRLYLNIYLITAAFKPSNRIKKYVCISFIFNVVANITYIHYFGNKAKHAKMHVALSSDNRLIGKKSRQGIEKPRMSELGIFSENCSRSLIKQKGKSKFESSSVQRCILTENQMYFLLRYIMFSIVTSS